MVPLESVVLRGSSQEGGEGEFLGPHLQGDRQFRAEDQTPRSPACWEDPHPKAGPLHPSQGVRSGEGGETNWEGGRRVSQEEGT